MSAHFSRGQVVGRAFGAGHYLLSSGQDVQFTLVGMGFADGTGQGLFRHRLVADPATGETIDFIGRVICMPTDPVTGRAWIGGVIIANRSTLADFQGPLHQPGRDIWFRLVDYGEGRNAPQPDRTTFVGFEGSAGIQTSEEYCQVKIWPGPGDARTNALRNGNLQVR